MRLDDTPLPSEHSFRLYLDWRKGQRRGKAFDRNLRYLARAIRGLPLEEKPWSRKTTLVSITNPVVEEIASRIISGQRLVAVYRHPVDLNPITGKNLSPAPFFDELVAAVTETNAVVVLDYDEDRMSPPFTYVPSYRLAKIAVESPAFAQHRDALETALRAYDAPFDSELSKRSDPWHEGWQGGARFLAEVAASIGKPILAILRNVHWELDGETEATYVYADELPALRQGLSVVLDVWPEDDWTKAAKLFDYVVDETEGKRKLINT